MASLLKNKPTPISQCSGRRPVSKGISQELPSSILLSPARQRRRRLDPALGNNSHLTSEGTKDQRIARRKDSHSSLSEILRPSKLRNDWTSGTWNGLLQNLLTLPCL